MANAKNGEPTDRHVYIDYEDPLARQDPGLARFSYAVDTAPHAGIATDVWSVILAVTL